MLQNNSFYFSIQIDIQWNLSMVWYFSLIGHLQLDIAGAAFQKQIDSIGMNIV